MKKLVLMIILFTQFQGVFGQELANQDQGNNIEIRNKHIDDLYYTCKIWGFLKYHHPTVMSGKLNWDEELFKIIKQIDDNTSSNNRNELLYKWVSSIEGVLKHNKFKIKDSLQYKLFPDYGWINRDSLGEELCSKLEIIKLANRPDSNYYVGFNIFPYNLVFNNEIPFDSIHFNSADYKLLALFRYWNAIEYCYPYKYLTKNNWDSLLKKYIQLFVSANNKIDYFYAISHLVAELDDSHAYSYGYYFNVSDVALMGKKITGKYYAPIEIDIIEEKYVVTAYKKNAPECGLKIGDVLLSIDGISVYDRMEKLNPYFSISNKTSVTVSSLFRLLSSQNDTINVQINRNDSIQNITIKCFEKHYDDYVCKSDCSIIENSIGYIYPGMMVLNKVDSIMNLLKETKGIIIDLRCYPKEPDASRLGKYLLDRPREFVLSTYFNPQHPGQFKLMKEMPIGVNNENYYKGMVVIIVNNKTQSNAEFSAMAWRNSPNAIIIGSQTAGADGNITTIRLPGGVHVCFTGAGVYYPDGGETQRVGVRIDEIVKPTIKGIREGRDEVLERAIEMINSKMPD